MLSAASLLTRPMPGRPTTSMGALSLGFSFTSMRECSNESEAMCFYPYFSLRLYEAYLSPTEYFGGWGERASPPQLHFDKSEYLAHFSHFFRRSILALFLLDAVIAVGAL